MYVKHLRFQKTSFSDINTLYHIHNHIGIYGGGAHTRNKQMIIIFSFSSSVRL